MATSLALPQSAHAPVKDLNENDFPTVIQQEKIVLPEALDTHVLKPKI